MSSRDGQNHCHSQASPALGHLRSNPSGSQTPGNPCSRSCTWSRRSRSRCAASFSSNCSGNTVTRSLSSSVPSATTGAAPGSSPPAAVPTAFDPGPPSPRGRNSRQHRARRAATATEQPVKRLLPFLQLRRPGSPLQALQLHILAGQAHRGSRCRRRPTARTPAHPALAAELFEALQCPPVTLAQTGREQAVVSQPIPPVRVRAQARRAIRVVPCERTRKAQLS